MKVRMCKCRHIYLEPHAEAQWRAISEGTERATSTTGMKAPGYRCSRPAPLLGPVVGTPEPQQGKRGE
eukprot:152183-Alexandrium_andersonii.AAC.1